MKTLFVYYRVTDLDRSLGFYTALGYVELGRVDVGLPDPGQVRAGGSQVTAERHRQANRPFTARVLSGRAAGGPPPRRPRRRQARSCPR